MILRDAKHGLRIYLQGGWAVKLNGNIMAGQNFNLFIVAYMLTLENAMENHKRFQLSTAAGIIKDGRMHIYIRRVVGSAYYIF